MFSSICKLTKTLSNRYIMLGTLSRGMAQKHSRMEDYFKEKRFVVTGASAGMGKEIAERLIDLESYVYVIGRDPENMPPESNKVKHVVFDVSDWDSAYQLTLDIGPVHGLVNNAGVAHIEPFLELSKHGWEDTLNVNARGMIRISQAVVKNMIAEGIKGSIVNVSSTISERVVHDHVSYCVSKGAVNQITRTMALEFGPLGIRTNNVCPTVVLTKMGKKAWSDPKKSKPIMDRIPLGRFAMPEDIADATIFLLSDYAKMVNGINLYVDGGFMTG